MKRNNLMLRRDATLVLTVRYAARFFVELILRCIAVYESVPEEIKNVISTRTFATTEQRRK